MLLNLSNHPSAQWAEGQKKTALDLFGRVADIPFPAIDPDADDDVIKNLAMEYASLCLKTLAEQKQEDETDAIHIMGELTFCFALVSLLQKGGITCIASTTRRIAQENKKGKKVSVFNFVKFRPYPNLCNAQPQP